MVVSLISGAATAADALAPRTRPVLHDAVCSDHHVSHRLISTPVLLVLVLIVLELVVLLMLELFVLVLMVVVVVEHQGLHLHVGRVVRDERRGDDLLATWRLD